MPTDRKKTRDAEGSIFKKEIDRKVSNGKTRKEIVYVVRVRRNEYDAQGNFVKEHELKRNAANHKDALSLRKALRERLDAKIKNSSKTITRPADPTFFDLINFYERNYVKEAVFVNGKKVAGQRDPIQNVNRMIRSFKEFFGDPYLTDITYSRLFEYKEEMLSTPYIRRRKRLLNKDEEYAGEIQMRAQQRFAIYNEYKSRKPATVHRYLSRLRRILSIGVTHQFLAANPFKQGDALIVLSIEETRLRICSFSEEAALLRVCGPPREHLSDLIVLAIDTFARENELFNVKGSDVNFDDRYMRVVEFNAKTLKERYIPLSDRAVAALKRIKARKESADWNTSSIVNFDSVSKAWQTAKRLADIDDLRWHDLRATGITRMLDAGIPVPVVMTYSGHDNYSTFKKYVRIDLDSIKEAAKAMSRQFAEKVSGQAKGNHPLSDDPQKSFEGYVEVIQDLDSVG